MAKVSVDTQKAITAGLDKPMRGYTGKKSTDKKDDKEENVQIKKQSRKEALAVLAESFDQPLRGYIVAEPKKVVEKEEKKVKKK